MVGRTWCRAGIVVTRTLPALRNRETVARGVYRRVHRTRTEHRSDSYPAESLPSVLRVSPSLPRSCYVGLARSPPTNDSRRTGVGRRRGARVRIRRVLPFKVTAAAVESSGGGRCVRWRPVGTYVVDRKRVEWGRTETARGTDRRRESRSRPNARTRLLPRRPVGTGSVLY